MAHAPGDVIHLIKPVKFGLWLRTGHETTGALHVGCIDNLIARGDMPVTIAVFINPGVVPAANANALPRFNRSFEYDGLGDAYVRFLVGEVLPEVKKKWNVTDDPSQRAIAGSSSGAIAAFTAAWERPDTFRRVFSTIGTYVGLRGGDQIHTLIRKCEPKPLRVFLQDGSNDLNIYGGDWWIANQQMLSALTFAGYPVEHVWGDGGHTGKQGGSILPQAMKWLWQEKEVKAPVNDRQPVMKVLTPGLEWELVGEGYKFTPHAGQRSAQCRRPAKARPAEAVKWQKTAGVF